jgi:adenine-specific DNA-methyltransferase
MRSVTSTKTGALSQNAAAARPSEAVSRNGTLDPLNSTGQVRRKPTDRKRTWGIFYTPTQLSRYLVEWAIKTPHETVLEPSFGGCGFLYEGARMLKKLGARNPWRRLCGCDKDSRAFSHLPQAHRRTSRNRRFLHSNFLETKPTDYCRQKFSVVIGNPPFVSRHNMRRYQLLSAEGVYSRDDMVMSRRASFWTYFVIHSLRFLKRDGRMAWVLPRSLSQSDYGRELVTWLCQKFEAVTVISLQKRLFVTDGADELVDVLLCQTYHPGHKLRVHPQITYADSLPQLKDKITGTAANSCAMPVEISSGREELLTIGERDALEQYGRIVGFRSFGEIARVKIGIVTGLTRFFVLKGTALLEHGLTVAACTPLLTRTIYARGLSWHNSDVLHSITSNHRIFLVRPDLKATSRYWASFPKELQESIATFKKRTVWNAPDDGQIPDAFFFGLVDNGPRLVLNDAKTNSNNSVHRVFLKSAMDRVARRALSMLFLSSYVQVSGELVGRICGSGGLKFELSDAAKLRVLSRPPGLTSSIVEELWPKVDLLLRHGKEQEAIQCVDNALQSATFGRLSPQTVELVQGALIKLRRARKGDTLRST